MSISDFHR
jgi:hypothetical protein